MLHDNLETLKKLIQIDYNSTSKKYIYNTIALINIVILAGQTISIYHSWGDIVQTTSSIAIYALKLQVCYKLFFLYWEKKRITRMHRCLTDSFWDTNFAGEIIENELNKWFRYVLIFVSLQFSMIAGVYTWFCTFPVTVYPPNIRNLPLQMWFPFNTNPSPFHEFLYGFLVASGAGNLIIILYFDFLYIYFSQHLIVQLKLLQAVLPTTTECTDSLNDVFILKNNETQNLFCKRLNSYIEHHATLLQFGKDLKIFSSISIAIQVTMSMLTLITLGFGITKVTNAFTGMEMGLLFMVMVVEIAIFGVHGSELEYQSACVAPAAYQCRWYLLRPEFRKNLVFLQMNAQKEFKISAAGFIVLNNSTLVQIFRGIFSAITLLQSFDEQ